jgi:hypothetical protein
MQHGSNLPTYKILITLILYHLGYNGCVRFDEIGVMCPILNKYW